jgi:hypothetical protein
MPNWGNPRGAIRRAIEFADREIIWRTGNKLGSALPTSLTLAASKRRIIPNILAKPRRKPLSQSQ